MTLRIAVLLTLFTAACASAAEPPTEKFTDSIGQTMVPIQPGTFIMGAGDGPPRSEEQWKERDWDESPAHKVTISRPYFLSAHEVTNAQYEQFDPKHKEFRGKFGVSRGDDEPVTFVGWQDAVDFCQWLSKKEGRTYRLPTEAEWEYACRAGTTTKFSTGDTLSPKQANIGVAADGKKKEATLPVGSFAADAWGLFDMHGNVAEWCSDWHGPYVAREQTDPVGRASGMSRVVRGGSYAVASWQDDNAHFCRSANRGGHLPDDANRMTGFRVVLGEAPTTEPLPPAQPPLHQRDVKQAAAPKAGPPADKPYFDEFRDRRPTMDDDAWGPIFSKWNHFTACCVCPNGDVLAAWYTTKSESGRELAQAASRLPAGSDTWQPASLFFNVPDVNDHAPVLLCDGKRIYHFASQSLRGWDETTNVMRTSDDNGATWSQPQIIFRREGPHNLSQACSAFATDDGTIYLAVDGSGHRTESLLISRDAGKTWKVAGGDLRKAAGDKYAIHPAIAPTKDGGIVAFLRGPDPMPRLVSHDDGESWKMSDTPLGGISVGQKATALRLQCGALLLCASDTRKPPITGQRGTLAALSYDDGQTWSHVRHVPGVGGYMSSAQAPNGVIYVFGTRMSAVAFNEAWLKEGPPVDPSK